MILRYTIAAALAGSWAVVALYSTVQGRRAYFAQVQPVIAQYREVLAWRELN